MQVSRRWISLVIAWNLMLTVATIMLAVRAACEARHQVGRLDVVEGDGTERMAITNRAQLPDLVIEGKHAPRNARAVQPAGIVLFDERGNEAGGFATVRRPDGSDGSMLVLDYGHSEAIAVTQRHLGDQSYEAALVINDPPLAPGSFEGSRRIAVSSTARAASIELADTRGRPRIRIAVDAADQPSITILDDKGAIVRRWPGS